MGRVGLKNYCIEPTRRDCVCIKRLGCGGIAEPLGECPEHGIDAALPVLMKTHPHPVQGQAVGTGAPKHYDIAKAAS